MDRKLAAILAADVVGYSALMERDEASNSSAFAPDARNCLSPKLHATTAVSSS
ncbi:hypothetical protein NKH14_20460 [Mesorhizobium sp. M1380]|uniref:hypothetical protein n=1 Tax=Mesorhizobium sp. M1380 TaxID=2957093 RepID=UPI00333D0658